jgi:hypothetical protein
MKFFIASPWRNKDAVRSLTGDLMRRGHIAYSFINNGANLATGTSVAEEVEQFGNHIADWGDNPLVERIFAFEMQALMECDTVILLEPAGRSSLTEAGIAYGMGKKVVLVGDVVHPEIVYRMCGVRYPSVEALLKDLDILAATGAERVQVDPLFFHRD